MGYCQPPSAEDSQSKRCVGGWIMWHNIVFVFIFCSPPLHPFLGAVHDMLLTSCDISPLFQQLSHRSLTDLKYQLIQPFQKRLYFVSLKKEGDKPKGTPAATIPITTKITYLVYIVHYLTVNLIIWCWLTFLQLSDLCKLTVYMLSQYNIMETLFFLLLISPSGSVQLFVFSAYRFHTQPRCKYAHTCKNQKDSHDLICGIQILSRKWFYMYTVKSMVTQFIWHCDVEMMCILHVLGQLWLS